MILREQDTEFVIESDGSILVISIDDENEPDFLRTVTYDVTYVASTQSKADQLAQVIRNTIQSDSWEQNGGGNGTLSSYQINGRILMSVNQSQRVHRAIRNHFDAIVGLGSKKSTGSRPITLDNEPIANRSRGNSLSSSVVELPQQQTTSSLRSRRGFARPNSGTSGGMGGGGFKGGGMF